MTDTVNDAPPSSITPGSVLAWPPNWVNAADDGMRSYSGPDSVLVQTDQLTRCDVSRHATTLVLWFAPTFMVFFMVVCWVMIDVPLFVQQVPADWYRSSDQHSRPRRRLWKKS